MINLKYMKYLLFSFLIIQNLTVFSQIEKDVVKYRADIITQDIVQNRSEPNEKILNSKVYGKEVEIIVDTLFKKYTLNFIDVDNKRSTVVFKYLKNYFDSKITNSDIDKLYLMECQNLKFFLIDYLNLPPFNSLTISFEKPLDGGLTLMFKITDVRKMKSLK